MECRQLSYNLIFQIYIQELKAVRITHNYATNRYTAVANLRNIRNIYSCNITDNV